MPRRSDSITTSGQHSWDDISAGIYPPRDRASITADRAATISARLPDGRREQDTRLAEDLVDVVARAEHIDVRVRAMAVGADALDLGARCAVAPARRHRRELDLRSGASLSARPRRDLGAISARSRRTSGIARASASSTARPLAGHALTRDT